MSNNLNIKNYIKLLKKPDLTETDKTELFSYKALVEQQISYNRRNEYFSLIQEFLAKKMNPSTFRAKFFEMQQQDVDNLEILEKDVEQLSNFSIDFQVQESPFSRLIDLLYDSSMLANELGPEDGISEGEFKVSIERAFSNSELFKF